MTSDIIFNHLDSRAYKFLVNSTNTEKNIVNNYYFCKLHNNNGWDFNTLNKMFYDVKINFIFFIYKKSQKYVFQKK